MSHLVRPAAILIVLSARTFAQGVVTTIAGTDWVFDGDGKLAIAAPLATPNSVTLDNQGNVVFVDVPNCIVAKIGADGILRVIAGNGYCADSSGQGGPPTSAAVAPFSTVYDLAGNLFIGEDERGFVSRVSSGIINRFTKSDLCLPRGASGLARDGSGNIYGTDLLRHRVCRLNPDGTETVVAGTGEPGASGDGGPATLATLNFPSGVAFDVSGNMFIADTGNKVIRKVTPNGLISTYLRDVEALSLAFDKQGALFIGVGYDVMRYTQAQGLTDLRIAGLGSSISAVPDNQGNILVADGDNHRVVKISAAGAITTIAGNGRYRYTGDGPALQTALNHPSGLAVARDGAVYFTEPDAHRVRKVYKGAVTTVVGNGIGRSFGDGGLGTAAGVSFPRSLAFDSSGNLYIAEGYSQIRKLTPDGIISMFAPFYGDLAVDSADNVYFASANQVWRVESQGAGSTLVAGTGEYSSSGDGGPAVNATFKEIMCIAFDPAGNLLIADSQGGAVRRVNSQKIISTIPQTVDRSARSLAFDAAGNLYLADIPNLTRITPGGTVSTWSGPNGLQLGDGELASSIRFGSLPQMGFDTAGNLFFSDWSNYRIREMLTLAPAMQASPQTLSLTAPAGGAAVNDSITAQGALAGLDFGVSVSTLDGRDWLTVDAAAASTPRVLQVTADPTGLTPGRYAGLVTITPAGATPAMIAVGVTFTVGPSQPPQLAIDRPSLSFAYPKGATARPLIELVSNAGGGSIRFSTMTATSVGQWLSASPPTGTVTPGKPAPVSITADPSGLSPGTYTGAVTFTGDSGGRITVPVTMTVSSVAQGLLLTQSGMSFTAVEQGGIVPPQSFGVVNTGTGVLGWRASTSTLSGGKWLLAAPSSGASDPTLAAPQVTVTVDPSGLSAGNYYGLVRIDAPGAANTPQVVTAFLQVLKAGSNPGAVVQPTELFFESAGPDQDPSTSSPSSKLLTLYNVSDSALTWRSNYSESPRYGDLFLAPRLGVIDPRNPSTVVVQPILGYFGTVTFEFSDGRVQSLRITRVDASARGAATRGFSRQDDASSCSPTRLTPAITTLPPSFTISAGWPVALSVDVRDDCGNPHVSGSVTVNFSNGDPPLVMNSLNNGTWQATWPTKSNPQPVALRINAVNDRLGISGTREVDGALSSLKDPPAFTQDSIVSAATPVSFTALAPGSIFSVYGDRLAENAASAQAIPLPSSLGNATVIIGDKQAPLFFASQGQINAVVPYGLNPNTTHQLLIRRGLTYSRPVPVDVAPAQPGIFTSSGTAIAFAYRGTAPPFLVMPQAPAQTGDVLVLYSGGLGMTAQTVDDGSPSPSTPVLDPVTATIGAQNASVVYAGLVAGLVGLYQVNLIVPSGITPGNSVPLTLSVSGQTSPPVSLSVQ